MSNIYTVKVTQRVTYFFEGVEAESEEQAEAYIQARLVDGGVDELADYDEVMGEEYNVDLDSTDDDVKGRSDEPYCNHDAAAVVDGVCECGERVAS
jgi:hypothetical protein